MRDRATTVRRTRVKRLLRAILVRLGAYLYGLRKPIAARTLPAFANRPRDVSIDLPRSISGPDRIHLGDDVAFGPGTFLIAVRQYPSQKMRGPEAVGEPQSFSPEIRIGNRVTSTAGLQIFSQSSVVIEDDVMFASNVFVNDGSHGFGTAEVPYRDQPIERIAPIRIGRGSWIGQNVVIMPGVAIGEMALIGANSVVTRDVPPRSIAVGAPARVIKQWDDESKGWVAVGSG